MRISTDNTYRDFGSLLSWPLVTLAVGLAIAAAFAVSVGNSEEARRPATAVSQSASTPAAPFTTSNQRVFPEVLYILVGSEEEATFVESAMYADAALSPEFYEVLSGTTIKVLATEDEEAAFAASLQRHAEDLSIAGIGLRVVDTRSAATDWSPYGARSGAN